MQQQALAITFTLIFLAIEAIWLVTIRNRLVILISCVTILFGVQILSLMITVHYYTVDRDLLDYFANLLLKDILLLLPIWVFFFTPFSFKRVKEILSTILTGLDQIFSGVRLKTKAALVLISFVIAVIISTPLGIIAILIPPFWLLLLDFPRYLSYSHLYQLLPRAVIQIVGSTTFAPLLGWCIYAWLTISIILTKRSFWFILYLLFILLLINNIVGCREALSSSM